MPADRYYGADWKNASLYEDSASHPYRVANPGVKELPLHIWRWEFLRRSEPYNQTFRQFWIPGQIARIDRMGGEVARPSMMRRLKQELAGHEPIQHDGIFAAEEQAALGYGLTWLINPNFDSGEFLDDLFFDHDGFSIETNAPPPTHLQGRVNRHWWNNQNFEHRARSRGKILVSIDPDLPLEPQLAEVRRKYSKSNKLPRPRTKTFALALRLLDAVASFRSEPKTPWADIWQTFSGEKGLRAITKEELKRKWKAALATQQTSIRPFGYARRDWEARVQLLRDEAVKRALPIASRPHPFIEGGTRKPRPGEQQVSWVNGKISVRRGSWAKIDE